MENNITGYTEIATTAVHWMDVMTIVFSFVTMIIVIYNLRNKLREKDLIEIYLIDERNKSHKLNVEVQRKYITRSEVSGVLGIFQKDSSSRHNIDSMSTKTYFKQILNVQNHSSKSIKIDVTQKELEQFNI